MGGDGTEEVGGWGGVAARHARGHRVTFCAMSRKVQQSHTHGPPINEIECYGLHMAQRSVEGSIADRTGRASDGSRFADRVDAWMNETGHPVPMMDTPTDAESQRAVDDSRRLFHRTLACWVCDVLALRRAGLDRPRWRPGIAESEWTLAA